DGVENGPWIALDLQTNRRHDQAWPGRPLLAPGGPGIGPVVIGLPRFQGAFRWHHFCAYEVPHALRPERRSTMNRIGVFVYGVLSYACFSATLVYAVGFGGGFGVPLSIDSGAEGPLATAVLVDLLLLATFALQHSVMARPAFKRWWTTI